MTTEQALDIWEIAGKSVIDLGPGENSFDLEKLLSNKNINDRHIEVIKAWLAERKDGHEEETDPL